MRPTKNINITPTRDKKESRIPSSPSKSTSSPSRALLSKSASSTTVIKTPTRKPNSNNLSNIITTAESGDILEEISTIQLSANSKSIVKSGHSTVWTGCKDGMIHIIDYESGNVLKKLEGPTYKGSSGPTKIDVTTMEVINEYIWTGSTEGIIRMWDRNTMELYRELQGHTACVCSIIAEPILSDEEYSSYRRSVFSGSHDWTIRVWDAAGCFIRQLLGHSSWVRCLYFERIENQLWSGGDEGSIRIWDHNNSGETIKEIEKTHTKGVMTFTSVNGKIWSGGGDGVINIWNSNGDHLQTIQAHKGWVNCMMQVADMIWTGSTDKTIRIWSDQGKQLKGIQFDSYIGALHKWGNRVWISTANKSLSIYRISNSKLLQRISKFDEDAERERLEQKMLLEKKMFMENQLADDQERQRRENELKTLLSSTQSSLLAEERARKEALFKIKEMEQLIGQLKKRIEYLEDLLEKERKLTSQLRAQLLEKEEEILELESKIEALELLKEDLEAQIELKEKELLGSAIKEDYEIILTSLKKQLENLLIENKELKTKYHHLKSEFDKKEEKLNQLNEKYLEDLNNFEKIKNEIENVMEKMKFFEELNLNLKKENENLKNEVENLMEQLKNSDKFSGDLQQELIEKNQILMKEIGELKEENKDKFEEYSKEKQLLNEKINLIENEKNKKENELNELEKKFNETKIELEEEIKMNQKEWEEKFKLLNDEMIEKNKDWNERYSLLEKQYENSQSLIESLRNHSEMNNDSNHQLIDENNQLKLKLITKDNEIETLNLQIKKSNEEQKEISEKNEKLWEEKGKDCANHQLIIDDLNRQLKQAIDEAIFAKNELKKLKIELDGNENENENGGENNLNIGLRQQLAILQAKNLELLNDDSAVREAKRNFQFELQKALSDMKNLMSENFEREIAEYKAQLERIDKDYSTKISDIETDFEKQIRAQKLSLDANYRDELERTKTNLQTYKSKAEILHENFQTLATWLMSGMNNNGIAPDSSTQPSVIKVAFMLKKGDRIKNWKRRLFILKSDGEVIYYGNTDSPKPRGMINLRDLTDMKQSPGTAELPDSLDIITPNRIWSLHFDNADMEKAWMNIIKEYMNKRRSMRM